MRPLIYCCAALWMANATAAEAQNIVANVDQVAAAMKRAGYSIESKQEAPGERYLRAQRTKDSYSFSVYFYGCDKGTSENCKSVQFYSGFNPKTKPTLAQMNTYAFENRWGRVYLDKVGDPVIEMDVDLEKGGMSEELFTDNLEYFETVLGNFGTFVFKND